MDDPVANGFGFAEIEHEGIVALIRLRLFEKRKGGYSGLNDFQQCKKTIF
jgi:hypothetical protein